MLDNARCIANNRLYSAREFSELEPKDISKLRRSLICNGCGNEAFFRVASPPRRGPCFGARPHKEGCSEATTDAGMWGLPGSGEQEERIFNSAGRIVISLSDVKPDSMEVEEQEKSDRFQGARRSFGLSEGATTNVTRRVLKTLLSRLFTNPEFRFSDTALTLPEGRGETTVRDFFVSFDQVEERAIGEFKGVWGLITDASYDRNGDLWLNTGDKSTVSFVVEEALVPEFMQLLEVQDLEDLSGAQALILISVRRSSGNKVYGSIHDLRLLALSLA